MDQILQSGGYGHENHEITVPRSAVGIIIGKNGETIKRLCHESGAKIQFQPDERPDSPERAAVISGTADQVARASHLIAALVEKGSSSPGNTVGSAFGRQNFSQYAPYQNAGNGYEASNSLEIIVPRSSVGIIIGKSGETIKRLSMQTGTKIQFKPDDVPNSTERNALIYGSPENINHATRLISDLVEKSNTPCEAATEIFFLHVPADRTGLVIGRGGATIRQICAETGANVELSRDISPNAYEKTFVIKGTPQQIQCAKHIIRIKLGDILPGTPMPSSGMLAGGGQFPGQNVCGSNSELSTMMQASQNSCEQQALYQPHQEGCQTVQQTGGSPPSINPLTGELDYSAQWAEYYRTMGMVEKAEQVELQIRQRRQQLQFQGGEQQTLYQPHQRGGQAIQQTGGSTPSINPLTGKLDYSSQWAEYYRTMGMIKQAEQVELQIRERQQQLQSMGIDPSQGNCSNT